MNDRSAPDSLSLVQELTNTLDIETGQDALDTAGGLADFIRAHRLSGLGLAPDDLPGIRRLREALRAVCLAHTGTDMPRARAVELAELLERAPLRLGLDSAGTARLHPAEGQSGLAALTARIATDIATADATGDWQRLKACEAHDCQWVFYDRSPAGRGRWCTMAVCGSRAKMRAYRAKKRA